MVVIVCGRIARTSINVRVVSQSPCRLISRTDLRSGPGVCPASCLYIDGRR